jgi:hypothetical protein
MGVPVLNLQTLARCPLRVGLIRPALPLALDSGSELDSDGQHVANSFHSQQLFAINQEHTELSPSPRHQ